MSIKSILALTAVASGVLGAGAAQAHTDVAWSVSIGVPLPNAQIVLGSGPLYAPRAPVFVRAAPVYVEPVPVYRVHDEWRAERGDDRREDRWHDRRDDRRDGWRDRSDHRGEHAVPARFDTDRDGVPDRWDHHPRDPRRN